MQFKVPAHVCTCQGINFIHDNDKTILFMKEEFLTTATYSSNKKITSDV
jgi:hypothetical protein